MSTDFQNGKISSVINTLLNVYSDLPTQETIFRNNVYIIANYLYFENNRIKTIAKLLINSSFQEFNIYPFRCIFFLQWQVFKEKI